MSTPVSPEPWQEGGFGLYIHWPFCQSKCPYCDFNSHVAERIDQTRWRDAYISEIRRAGAETSGRVLGTVFFGGGTPSLMQPDVVASVLEAIFDTWTPANDIEITLEANPGSVEAARFRGFREAGVNRVSLGVQALNDPDLRALGRLHSVAEARAALDIARATFERVSFDLIYARQNQTLSGWQAELTEALSMAADHLSLYQLTIEPGTAFGARHDRGLLRGLPDDDVAADMYFATQDICDAAGLSAYETSNHARPGAESRHNLIYWRGGDYIGIGPGAHGRMTFSGTRYATDTPLAPGAWLDRVARTGSGEANRDVVPPNEQALEYAMMGLRLSEGIDRDRYRRIAGQDISDTALARLAELDLIETSDATLRVTRKGRPLLNAILRELLA
ncbi:radical SAM family heme chaperone HemW [Psychromarinibacter sp. C21-152]|uniref:Heme chaperone HemW n=1 Tax=Psychromarinibacter sediminicola TaxID=3033385 RepID=A0AAE3NUL9_9RHOB|nr:radical SAM family heme chaperone HemW [Psychromarinibacter sediminicola]MDF0601275.1 radical SAM family heme chaperone HemW [Psychromarinibacter sediminicola]